VSVTLLGTSIAKKERVARKKAKKGFRPIMKAAKSGSINRSSVGGKDMMREAGPWEKICGGAEGCGRPSKSTLKKLTVGRTWPGMKRESSRLGTEAYSKDNQGWKGSSQSVPGE